MLTNDSLQLDITTDNIHQVTRIKNYNNTYYHDNLVKMIITFSKKI